MGNIMAANQIREVCTSVGLCDAAAPIRDLGQPSAAARLHAWAFAAKFDRQIEAGIVPMPGSALAAHIIRLTSVQERESVARSFRLVLKVGQENRAIAQAQVAVRREQVEECRGVIDDITLRLHSPRPVGAAGMARLRLLLSDGAGPLYFHGTGNLAPELRDALAAQ